MTSFMMGLDDPARQAELQIGFVSHVVLPMWRSMSALFPPMSEAVANCEANLEVYKDDLVRAKQRKNSKPQPHGSVGDAGGGSQYASPASGRGRGSGSGSGGTAVHV